MNEQNNESKDNSIPEDLPSDPTISYKNKIFTYNSEDPHTQTTDTLKVLLQKDEQSDIPFQSNANQSQADFDKARPPLQEKPQTRYESHICDYFIYNKIGIGGNGEIWEAIQSSLKRIVAVKKIRQDIFEKATKGLEFRTLDKVFLQEAITTANLDHPNIVPVYSLGHDEKGCPFLAMKLVRGKPWKDIICEDKQLNPGDYYSRHILILIQVAQAISFAHSKSIIHRDLKPSQVMIGEFGEVIVMDWGIAYFYPNQNSGNPSIPAGGISKQDEKLHETKPQDTQNQKENKIIVNNPAGTPAFMAPEQTEENLLNIGPWTDIFLLGGILYYILTFTPPYHDSNSKSSYMKAKLGKIDDPRMRAPDREIPDELVKVTQKAMAYSPKDRFVSVQDFIGALQDYISGAGKRRESISIVDSVEQQYSNEELSILSNEKNMDSNLNKDEDYRALSERLSLLARAESLWSENPKIKPLREKMNIAFTQKSLKNNFLVLARLTAEHIEDLETRNYFLSEINTKQQKNKRIARERKLALVFTGLLLLLLIVGSIQYSLSQKAARIKAETAKKEALAQKAIAERLQYLSGIGFANAYEQEGRFDKSISTLLEHVPESLRNWEWGFILNKLFSDDMLLCKGPVQNELFHADFSPDGNRIVTGQRGGTVSLWDLSTGRKFLSKKLNLKGIWTAKFSPDGTKILATSVDGTANILDASSLEPLTTFSGMRGVTKPVMRGGSFSPDGKFAVTTGNDKYARIWDTITGEQKIQIQLPQNTYDAVYSPDGRSIAVAQTGSSSAQLVLCDAITGEIIREYPGHKKSVFSVRFSPDGKHLLTSSLDQSARIFDVDTGELLKTVDNPNAHINCAAFNSDGTIFATAGNDGVCRVYDSASGSLITKILCAPEVSKVIFHPKEQKMLSVSYYEIKLWDIDNIIQKAACIPLSQVPADASIEYLRAPSFPYDRNGVWMSYDDFWISGDERKYFKLKNNYYCIDSYNKIYSPDKKFRLSIDNNAFSAIVYSNTTDQQIAKLRIEETFNACISRDSKLLATGSMSGELQIWDTTTWKEISKMQSSKKVALWSLQFSPDSSLLAIGWLYGGITMWDVANNKILYEINDAHVQSKPVTFIEFSADGSKFVSASCDKSAKVWETKTGKPVSSFWGHQQGNVITAVFSPDGSRILTTGFDNKIKLWETNSGWEILNVATLPNDQGLMSASFSKDGKRVFAITKTGSVYEINSLPWNEKEYPENNRVPFLQRVELLKRQSHISGNTQLKDIEDAFK